MDPRPISAFYCCYLLRSKERGRSFYIGSTPNPRRRLAQHNGDTKGGAVHTGRGNRRPWDMTCIVAGFPSNIAALQFEWAWQNFHTTKKIPDDQRLDMPKEAKVRNKSNVVPSDGEQQEKKRKKLQRPPLTLKNTLSNLHLLLRVPSFNRLPLAVRFLCSDVYKAWLTHSKRDNGELPEGFRVFRDFEHLGEQAFEASASAVTDKMDSPTMAILEKIDVTYSGLKPHIAKSIALASEMRIENCSEPRMRKSKVTENLASCNNATTEIWPRGPTRDLRVLLEDGLKEIDLLTIDPEDDRLSDGWQELVDDDDNMSVTSTESGIPSRHGSPAHSSKQRQKLEIVIEDSEWDSTEAL
ncbi:MAG: hypothetical protein Q9178_004843 [Gyalolechia marmorata]